MRDKATGRPLGDEASSLCNRVHKSQVDLPPFRWQGQREHPSCPMKIHLPLGLFVLAIPVWVTAQTITLSYWDLNSVTMDTPSDTTLSANLGSGVFRFGPNNATLPETRWDVEGGTTVNLQAPSVAGNSLRVTGGQSSNGAYFQMEVSTVGYKDLVLSFAQMTDNANGQSTNQLKWSTDGSSFTDFGSSFPGTSSTSYAVRSFDLSTITQLNDQPTVFLRVVLGGATGTQFTRDSNWDNFHIQAIAIPEPATGAMALGVIVVGAILWQRRLRSRA